MNNKLFFTALTALTLSLGLTACSNDDDSIGNDNAYKEVYRLRFQVENKDSVALQTVMKAYEEAIGCDADTAIVTGKDSVSCMAKFTTMMEKAEQKLANITWDDIVTVRAFNKDHDRVYQKRYALQDNAFWNTRRFKTEPFKKSNDAPELGKEDIFVSSVSTWGNTRHLSVPYYICYDVHDGACDSEANIQCFINEKPNRYVSGLFVLVGAFVRSFTYDGTTYYVDTYNFNSSTPNGPALYLAYSNVYTGRRLLANGLALCEDYIYNLIYDNDYYMPDIENHKTANLDSRFYDEYAFRYDIEFLKGVTVKGDGSVEITYPDGVDMNLGRDKCERVKIRTVWARY